MPEMIPTTLFDLLDAPSFTTIRIGADVYHGPMTAHVGTPNDDSLNPTSLTRLLARSLLLEALGMTRHTPDPHEAVPSSAVQNSYGRQTYWTPSRILNALRGFVARAGTFPNYADWRHARALGLPSRPTVLRQYGSLKAVRILLDAEIPT